jgi:arylsulfatase
MDRPGQTWRVDGTVTTFGNKPSNAPGPAGNFLTSGPAWASLQNTPFRKHKMSNHEGGIATPCIAWWPAVITQAGAITHELGHISDLMATCLDAAGVPYPAEFAGRKLHPLAGRSLLPIFRGGAFPEPRTLGWATKDSRALREGNWKLVAAPKGPWELYNMAVDRTELNDLAAQQPGKVQELAAKWEKWAADGKSE